VHDALLRRDALIRQELAALPADALVVNVGCGLLRRFEAECSPRYLTTDLRMLDSVDFVADASRLPLADDSVDALIVLEMLEHVPDPLGVVRELARVLKPGGTIFLSVPSAVPRHDYHDYWRFTAQGLEAMGATSFVDGTVHVFGGTFEAIGHLAAYYVSLLLHVARVPGRTYRQFFPTVGRAIDERAEWTTSTTALHTIAFDLLFIGRGPDGPVAGARPRNGADGAAPAATTTPAP
jgi:SAM-dependent methyltransferase